VAVASHLKAIFSKLLLQDSIHRISQVKPVGVFGDDLFADQGMAIDDDGNLQIDRGLPLTQSNDVKHHCVGWLSQFQKLHVVIAQFRLVVRQNQESRRHLERALLALQHLQPQERALLRVGQQNIILDPFKSRQTKRKANHILGPVIFLSIYRAWLWHVHVIKRSSDPC
jgi:hypothetical protein